jgi:hypothetical protein
MSIPSFLDRLTLDLGAGMTDIRRAYARELKLIDQEHDAAGFQALREAYECALEWSRLPPDDALVPQADPVVLPATSATAATAAFAAPVPVVLAKVAPPEAVFPEKTPVKVDPQALGDAVFADFMEGCARMMLGRPKPDLDACRAVLERALAQPALLNISARIHFEQRVAHLLAGGWKPGHEILLVAATSMFEWRADRRRLFGFGEDGMRLSLAIDQRTMFDAQPSDEIMAQRDILVMLRANVQPAFRELVCATRHLDALETRFPVWLALVADIDQVARLRERVGQISGWQRTLMGERKGSKAPPPDGERENYTLLWIAAIVVINILRYVF